MYSLKSQLSIERFERDRLVQLSQNQGLGWGTNPIETSKGQEPIIWYTMVYDPVKNEMIFEFPAALR